MNKKLSAIIYRAVVAICSAIGHDFYNGGAICGECGTPRPKSDPWWGRAALKAASEVAEKRGKNGKQR